MVKDISDTKFVKEFKKKLKENTVYIVLDKDSLKIEVFSSLKLAKKFVTDTLERKVTWFSNPHVGFWLFGSYIIRRKQIVKA